MNDRNAYTILDEWQGVCSEMMSDGVRAAILASFMKRNGIQSTGIQLTDCCRIDKAGLTDALEEELRFLAENGMGDEEAQ